MRFVELGTASAYTDVCVKIQRIIFSHTAIGSDSLAIQVIMTATLSDGVDQSLRSQYCRACAAVLRQLGPAVTDVAWNTVLAAIAEAFVEIMHTLSKAQQVCPLSQRRSYNDLIGS
jgi:hypothetical protein